MKIFIQLFFFISFLFPANILLADIEKGKWNYVKENDYCFIVSLPTNSDMPEGKKRGKTYVLVYRMNKNPDAIVQIEAGYPYDQNKIVEVKIDNSLYKFSSEEETPETAWTNEDKKVIYAMKKGLKLTIFGISSRGTKTVDTYTLNGFTAAYNKLINDC
ncbi:MAG: hypothetical protein HVK41_02125 [Pelagibacteraceae bacterium]|jgi:hypothetical protein|nr:hypothetical protein [Pelagibacteraceae bacterium]HJO13825.1 invasion associated locus B family protein [Alphaproteobacteria bacterium]MBO6466676.1 hypothetical protein [Pelagibacteraceae bacterium]MBO6468256.1 hypothetical protein [Pelagibacteraceae bacterium]MBO6469795.1 hypothetical protein [Pelagibacteraceae bacterium]|tara:strand:+ start:977 stop:1453 length:477 start_codon:yes stop_codon:yes gene_type:complete